MKKKVLPLLILIVCIVCCCFPVTANAETADCIVRGEDVVAAPDSDVTMNITIENNPGIAGAELIVGFDERVTLTNATVGDVFSAFTYTPPAYYRDPTIFAWDSKSIKDEDIKDGVVLTLTFHVAKDVEGNVPVMISYVYGDVFDKNLNPMELTTVNGNITVISYMPGDADGNGRLNTLDATAIRRYISDGRVNNNVNGYNVNINENAADVDGNGRINTLDITMILRYISDGRVTNPDGYNVTLKPGKIACTHSMTHTPAKPGTCAEAGNIEYWHCSKCDKYFADADGKYEMLYENTQIPSGHTYAEEWTYDEDSHWHDATCEHKEEPADLAEHTFVNHICSECGAEELVSVTFVDNEGAIIDAQYVPYGENATAPEVPERLGYVFDRWDGSFNAVTDDVTVKAKYIQAHIVTFADNDGTVLKQQSVRDGEAATAYVFTAADVAPEGYERTGWDKSFDNIKEDIVVFATYARKTYTVKFYMPDGTLIDTQTVEYGSDAETPNCDESYFDWNTLKIGEFSGWSQPAKGVKSDLAVYAQYNKKSSQPVISIDTANNRASVKLHAPENCYLYAIDFGFNWSGNISILSCERNIASNLYKGDAGAFNIDFNNKYDTFHYTWTNAAGVKLDDKFTTVLDIQFVTDGNQVVNKDVLKFLENCSIIYSTEKTTNMDELNTITPVMVIK